MGSTREVDEPKMQVIVLGCGGGPREDNTTSFLVRSTATKWSRGSLLAVDAGTHLAAITRILEKHLPAKTSHDADELPHTLTEGPFKGLKLPNFSASANAGYIVRTIVDAYLITHPHLDHISGFVINTSSLPGTRPKRLAGLPSTINAFKEHIFNNVIWPNLSDENNGAGLVTYMRLVEGGSPAMGDGEGKGYMEICEGLSVKTWSVSHGHCIEKHSHRGSNAGLPEGSPRLGPTSISQMELSTRSSSGRILSPADVLRTDPYDRVCVYDSSAYFIRDIASGREVLIFGDVEPDSISLSPRNKQVWSEAAPKVVAGQLGAIFIECSYDDSRSEDTLFGHLAPRYLIEELKSLVAQVHSYNGRAKEKKKRKRISERNELRQRSTRTSLSKDSPVSPLTRTSRRSFEFEVTQADGIEEQSDGAAAASQEHSMRGQGELLLRGIKVVVIHTKEKLDDGPAIGDLILQELLDWESEEQLGCEFIVPKFGDALYF
ncbi:3',5'-cyclic-nucleotide phosphodiesterase [Lachnellula hyalina]|uniref:3',5'-cyclic-nucleotide phosphodiesterase n=1 Tax=Lachnellula hyalina TaxID=1316788 RepID=A0A8H8R0U3_9HELO|nr:3',5'-cyclic-nucleotide phosphodiesterase [Lachnellula hyalina]TVY26309.1 3',5'-cyclic-nucleotide phosphodiesterase [Lachnellula hyalina]